MGKSTDSSIDRMLRAARESQPDLWKRTESVARIISPEAFADDGWTVVEPESARRLHERRMRLVKAAAMSKAQAVLTFLGVNTDADWFDILQRMAKDSE
jgi:hypothetical protein